MLVQGGAASQAEIRAMLGEHGISATQATISRDLRELGASKGPSGYFLPNTEMGQVSPAGQTNSKAFQQVLQSYVVGVEPAGNLLVLRTGVGQAQVVAVEFDRNHLNGVVGVIAGDDTIFIAMTTPRAASELAARIRSLAGIARIGGAA